jgi:hypothetical protein
MTRVEKDKVAAMVEASKEDLTATGVVLHLLWLKTKKLKQQQSQKALNLLHQPLTLMILLKLIYGGQNC